MTKLGPKSLTAGKRLMGRLQRAGVRGDLIKRLAELIKNCDDAYDRLELDGQKTSGIIQVAYDSLKTGKGYSLKGFLVRDFGAGMSLDTVKSAYYGEVHGDDTSGETRNGAIGVGGKDAFVDMEDCYVLTVHDGNLTVVELQTEPKTGQISTDIFTDDDADAVLTIANKKLKQGNLEEISLSKNQTLAMFRIPDNVSGTNSGNKLAEQLTNFYTLRWILESDIRTVTLTDLNKSQTFNLNHSPIQGEILKEISIEIPFEKVPYKVDIQLLKSDQDLVHKTDYGVGILLQDHRGAILDNQMYGVEEDSGAKKLFGKIIFHDWKKLYRQSGGLILTNNREGLEKNHPVNKILRQHVLTHLKPLVEAERDKQGDNPQLDKNLDNNMKKALDYMNKLINQKSIINIPEPPITPPADGLEFESSQYTFTPLKPQTIRLFINPGMIPTDSIISLSLIGDGITIKPNSTINTSLSYDTNQDGVIDSKDDIPFVEIEVTGKDLTKPQTITTLKAIFGDYQAETTINIAFESGLRQPVNGFSFMPTKTTIIPKKSRKIQLVIDTNQISIGSPIRLTCNDSRIKFSPNNLTVSGPPKIGKYLTQEIITISGEKVGIKAILTAEVESKSSLQMGQSTRDIRESKCEIEVKDKPEPKTFFKDYDIDRAGNPRVRSRFNKDDGMVWIHNRNPILKFTFGKDLEHIRDKKPDALALLADVVVSRFTYEYAKHLVETQQIDVLSDDTTAIEAQKDELEFEHGLNLTQLIIKGSAKHEKDL